jgi:hypothetical protein
LDTDTLDSEPAAKPSWLIAAADDWPPDWVRPLK